MYCSLMGIRKDLSLLLDFRQAGVGRDELPLAVRESDVITRSGGRQLSVESGCHEGSRFWRGG